jgi:drug/metabolite transporter superfamily protein YnfA
MLWSYILAAVGIFGLWLSGRKDYRGWFVGLGAQILWVTYALVTVQYGFILSAVAYGAIYLKNGMSWMREKRAKEALDGTSP